MVPGKFLGRCLWSRLIVTAMPLVFSTDPPAPKRVGLVFPPKCRPSAARCPPAARIRPPRLAPPRQKRGENHGRPKDPGLVATRQLLDTRLSTLAGIADLAQGGCRCGTCEHRLQQAYGDPDLPIEFSVNSGTGTDSVSARSGNTAGLLASRRDGARAKALADRGDAVR